MPFNPDQLSALEAKLDKSAVATRKQAGRDLSYIEGWHAIAEANRIFGFDAWDRQAIEMRQLGEPREVNGNIRVGYACRVRITVRAGDTIIIREGCGFGSGIDKDVDQAHESALKEAETDAMKRALMTFGNPFGLALYDKQQANVASAPDAADFAIKALKAATSGDDFKQTWEKNKANWKQVMDGASYARVVAVMQSEAKRWAPKAESDPFSGEAA